jgi:hypothetical protein
MRKGLKSCRRLPMGRGNEAAMGIGPIPGIGELGGMAPPHGELQVPTIFEIEGIVRPGYEKGQGSGRKGAGAEENIEAEEKMEKEPEPVAEEETEPKNVDLFA